jgi:membrane-associated progesterone receptor component
MKSCQNVMVLCCTSQKNRDRRELMFGTGSDPSKPTLVAIKGTVFDVSGNDAYGTKGQYHGQYNNPSPQNEPYFTQRPQLTSRKPVFAGKDPSRALATSSLKAEDCVPEWDDLDDKYKTVLSEWFTFFSKRYNVVGKVEGATNLG